MSRKPFKALKEALDYCFSDEIEADIALIPPEVDNLTDKDEGPDDEIAVPDILDVFGTVEVLEQDDISDEEVEQPEASTPADEDEDLGISLVRNAMSRNTYLELKSAFYVQDNSEAHNNKKDKSFKIRFLLELQKPLSIKEFRRASAVPYLQLGHGSRVAKGRPISTPSTSRTHVPGDVRFDGKNHLIKKREQQRRCQYSNCKGRPLTYCSRCLVTLCTACFPLHHTP
ncbi:hypothetical protein ILUMI_11118 [Ignelater luminosus]|uniref:PiggyBac transposable element-derived protein domain-containing protein n=1 Tax=Ignelater luminosus TaxID=2038154 RepID=A0A8K0D2P4_IGNLU|nr:hypothetical protein ILUMI_11118 [Ignelater luminosus]